MKPLKALYFPGTLPSRENLSPFLAICDTISFYTLPPAPPSPTTEDERWAGYCPAALTQEEFLRFAHLVKEIQGREREFYHGLLSSFSPASRSRDEESGWSLLTALRDGRKKDTGHTAEQETLWRSMLVLKLAELLAQEEEEVAQGLTAISTQEAELLAAIRGEDLVDDEDEERELLGLALSGGKAALDRPAAPPERLAKAWGNLYLRDALAGNTEILATAGNEMRDLLADAHESLSGRSPEKLALLHLPGTAALAGGEGQEPFALGEPGKRFRQLLREAAGSPALSAGLRRELEQQALEISRIVPPGGRNSPGQTLTVYGHQGHSCLDLFARLCNRHSPETGAKNPSGPVTGLLAVLT